MQSNTSFFDQLPNELKMIILEMAAGSASAEIAIPQVDKSFKKILSTIPIIPQITGYYSRNQEKMDPTFFNVIESACQKVDNLHAHHPSQPIMMSKDSVKPPVSEIMIFRDIDLEKFVRRRDDVDLEKFVRCDISKVHTVLFSLTDRQFNYECTTDFARVVYSFTLNKFPSLKCLVLNNVYLTDKLLKCLQQYNLKFLHLWYFSWHNNFDKNFAVSFESHLENFQTLAVVEFQMDLSVRFMFSGFKVKLPPRTMKSVIINILGECNLYNIKGNILFDAFDSSSLEIFQVYCDPSFPEAVGFIPPMKPTIKKFAWHAKLDQMMFHGIGGSPNWGDGVVELCMNYDIRYTGTTFPNCRVHTSHYTSDKTPTAYGTIYTGHKTPITKCKCCFTSRFMLVYAK